MGRAPRFGRDFHRGGGGGRGGFGGRGGPPPARGRHDGPRGEGRGSGSGPPGAAGQYHQPSRGERGQPSDAYGQGGYGQYDDPGPSHRRGGPGPPFGRGGRDREFTEVGAELASSRWNTQGVFPSETPTVLAVRNLLSHAGRKSRLPVQAREAPTQEVRLERLARERVSRTLFIRNVAYEVDSQKLRRQFEEFGEIKDWFDAIRRRGMVFVTFYDVRAAERGRREMMGTKLYGRNIDVHFSLPKDHDQDGPCDASKNQGSLMVTLSPRRMLEERELGAAAEVSGAVKGIKSCGYQEKRIVEFYDSRAAQDFYERMNGRPFMGGRLHLEYIWDVGEVVNHDVVTADAIHQATTTKPLKNAPVDTGSRRDSYESNRGRDRPPHERDYEPRPYDGPSRYSETPPTAAQPTGRLDQARKVQDLLASLGSVANLPAAQPAAPPPPPAPYVPPSQYGPQSSQGYPPSAPASVSHPPTQQQYPPYPPPPAPAAAPPAAPAYPPYPAPSSHSHYPPPAPSYPPSVTSYPPPPTSSYPPSSAPSYPPASSSYPPPPAPSAPTHPQGNHYMPGTNYTYSPPTSHYPAPVPPKASPTTSAATLPAQVLAMLNGQQPPAQQSQQPARYSAPQQSQDGYDPNNAKVGSLLNMLQRQQ